MPRTKNYPCKSDEVFVFEEGCTDKKKVPKSRNGAKLHQSEGFYGTAPQLREFLNEYSSRSSSRASAKKTPTRRSPARRTPTKKSPVRRSPARRTPTKRTPTRRTPTKRTPTRRTPTKKSPARRTPGRRTPGRRSAEQKSPAFAVVEASAAATSEADLNGKSLVELKKMALNMGIDGRNMRKADLVALLSQQMIQSAAQDISRMTGASASQISNVLEAASAETRVLKDRIDHIRQETAQQLARLAGLVRGDEIALMCSELGIADCNRQNIENELLRRNLSNLQRDQRILYSEVDRCSPSQVYHRDQYSGECVDQFSDYSGDYELHTGGRKMVGTYENLKKVQDLIGGEMRQASPRQPQTFEAYERNQPVVASQVASATDLAALEELTFKNIKECLSNQGAFRS